MSRSSRKKKKSIFRSTFYRVYFALVALALVGIAVGTVWLRGMLAEYESAQPIYVAEDVARLFEVSDFESLYDLDSSAADIAQGDRAFYVRSMQELTQGRLLEWTEAFSTDENERRYVVTLDGERFATFTLVPSGETTRRGTRLWRLGSVTTHVQLEQPEPEPEPETTAEPEPEATPAPTYECRVTVPSGYAVTVDGVQLSEDNAIVTPKYLFETGFLPEGVQNPMLTEYYFAVSNESPALVVTDETGAAATLTPSEDKPYTWSCEMKEDTAYRDQYADAAYALAQQVAKFTSKDASKKKILKYCAPDSPARAIFDNLSNKFATPHTKVSFANQEVSEFYVLSEDCFTCHVSFDYILKTKAGDKVFPTAYTFCVIRQNGKGMLYNLQIY